VGFSLYAQSPCESHIPAALCGTQLAIWPQSTGQPALSNGPDQGTACSCAGSDLYQCVNYVQEYYINVVNDRGALSWTGNANAYFQSAAAKGLLAFSNGGHIPPEPSDILVFQGGHYGHVAIVETVSESQVTIIEQNWSPTGTTTLPVVVASGTYTLGPRGNYAVVGWLRYAGTAHVNTVFSEATYVSETGPNTIATFDDVAANTFAPFVSDGVSFVGIPAPPAPLPEVINSLIYPDLFWFPGVGSPPNFLLTNIGPFQATFPVDARAMGFDYNCFACDGTASQDSVAWTLLSASGDVVGSGVTTTDFTVGVKFFGLISDTPFRTVQISRSDPKNWELDNLRYSQ